MRIYTNPLEAARETERDLFEMGISVQPQTMQDKDVRDNSDYKTLEIRGYGFKIVDWHFSLKELKLLMGHFFPEKYDDALTYIVNEFQERVSGTPTNPGNSYKSRQNLWSEFMHKGKFAYTYSERMYAQVWQTLNELTKNPESRQGIINIHSNICAWARDTMLATHPANECNIVNDSIDRINTGGSGRIPCSMYYQIMIRENKLDLIYTMRSCDLLVHFPIDMGLALCLLDYFADKLGLGYGTFTYFTGSLHAYQKDMDTRGIF